TQLNGELINMVLPDIDLTGGIHSLVGPWAEILDYDAPFKGTFSQAGSAFDFNRFEDAFEAANTYWQIDNYMRYMNVTLGLDVRPYQYPGGVQFDPHGFNGADNSSYSSGSGRLQFGEGGVDDAEDADVIIHELGHGIHDWVTAGGLSQVNGLSEGTGDYFAQSYSRSLDLWSPGDPQYHWVFSWDGHNPFWPGRTTDYFGVYPDDLTGSIHTDGQIWSTCNMLIWDAIGRMKTDKAFWAGLGMTGGSTN
ncbi:MAG: peptidase, partial [bacterium]|nr:peptidase [bacterium]